MKNQQGFIALTSVLVLSALFLSLVISATLSSVGVTQIISAVKNGGDAELLSSACVEYALMNIERELHYTGDEVLSFDTGVCEIMQIDETLDGTRYIEVLAQADEYVFRVIVELSAISPELVISSYKSVSEF